MLPVVQTSGWKIVLDEVFEALSRRQVLHQPLKLFFFNLTSRLQPLISNQCKIHLLHPSYSHCDRHGVWKISEEKDDKLKLLVSCCLLISVCIICTVYTVKFFFFFYFKCNPIASHFSPWSKGMELVHPRSQRSPVLSCAAGMDLMPGAIHLYGSINNSLTSLAIHYSTPD